MATPSALPYPYAAAADIIRAHQKDAYFKGTLANSLSDLHRRLLGVRSAHAWSRECRTFADALYLCLTTLVGNRTLGEEYCDVVQVHAQADTNDKKPDSSTSSDPLPALSRRAAYVTTSVLLPYLFSRTLPSLRTRLRRLLEARLARLEAANSAAPSSSDPKDLKGTASTKPTRRIAIYRYLLAHLPSLTSSAPFHALTLTTFYFTGTYYELAKRLLSLRYVFTRAVPSTPDRAGYELLGLLLLVQLSVQSYLHLRHALLPALRPGRQPHAPAESSPASSPRRRDSLSAIREADVTLNDAAYAANTSVLLPDEGGAAGANGRVARVDIARLTHTPLAVPEGPTEMEGVGGGARYDLRDEKVMAFVAGAQQRKCTLCLEEMRDPAATSCGHVFCWDCIGDWVREKPECPLCRREATVQHILPLRVG